MKPKMYRYTKETIALAAGVSASKVRKDVRLGEFDPESLLSTSAYVCSIYLRKKGVVVL